MTRQYTARAFTGRDFIYFDFSSDYRANSKGNKADAQKQYKRRTGSNVKVLETFLIK